MIQKAFDLIEKSDIDSLIDNRQSESKILEYKQDLPGETPRSKKEFLADVSSFSNASGGYIIYGIREKRDKSEEKTGLPESVQPIQGSTPDQAILRMEQIIRDGITPRLRFQIRSIRGWGSDGNEFVILLHIPKSFASPHMVVYDRSQKIYSRTSAGKYLLDVHEIRAAFLATDSQHERLKRFRQDRLGQIISDEAPIKLASPRRFVIHIIPIASFINNERLNIEAERDVLVNLRPMGVSGWDHRFNLDGFITYGGNSGDPNCCMSYSLLYFNGVIEAVVSGIGNDVCLPFEEIINMIIVVIQRYITVIKSYNITTPVVVSAAILGCKGLRAVFQQGRGEPNGSCVIDRDAMILPDVILEEYENDIHTLVRPMLDAIWNMCGMARCSWYDSKGRRIARG